MKRVVRILVVSVFLLAGCVSQQVSPDAVDLSVDFSWAGTQKCSRVSPEIRVGNTPPGTAHFAVKLKDWDAPSWNHGGGKVAHDGSGVIPAGALKSGYNGPCPPSGSHRYEFTVKAVDQDGVVIGIGKKMVRFP